MSSSQVSTRAPASRRRPLLPAGLALAGAAITFTSLYLAAGALTPLLVVYKEQWNFPASLLTVAFAVYAIGFLAAVLTVGSLSDHIGRRPVLIGALVVQVASNLLFLVASDIGWVIAGRIVQGVASGAATTAFTAALVELAPPSRKRLGMILGSVGLTGGLGFGSLLAGLAIQLTTAANTIIFVVLTVVTILGTVVVALSPESVTRSPGALRSLIPRIAFPPATRREFAAAAPVVAAVWMLAGLSGGIAPNMVRSVFHLNSGLLNGLAGFIAPATSAVIGLVFARVDSRRAMTIGIYASIIGAVGIISGVYAGSLAIMILGQAIAGVGFGASFTAALRLIFPLAAEHQRAGVVGGIYLVSYVALGLPIVIEGQLTGPLGEIPAVTWYTGAAILLALMSLVAQLRLKRSTPSVSGPTSSSVLRSSDARTPERDDIPA
ncbi:putative MFS family arabinose efflux permease [Kribbella orskensis]|uniref:MFS family arabinose efflux permease n=1 Tax=Kribbella orskensis TaxID=2512216 RepID=A0ABY2BMS3_9ACTN|nr:MULTISPECIES: MFS transporter [Kribbella]TCN41854.1 putative MFS family arabinose efflux permease [Kribbella sp. VKM Ac-2500]TCO25732.1 putative MFS family arabinose efflux permease [Kribbella orskensis]